jgi:hypothetical protein
VLRKSNKRSVHSFIHLVLSLFQPFHGSSRWSATWPVATRDSARWGTNNFSEISFIVRDCMWKFALVNQCYESRTYCGLPYLPIYLKVLSSIWTGGARRDSFDWKPGKFKKKIIDTISREENNTIFSGLMISEMTLSNQSHFPGFFIHWKVSLKIPINSGLGQVGIARPRKVTVVIARPRRMTLGSWFHQIGRWLAGAWPRQVIFRDLVAGKSSC